MAYIVDLLQQYGLLIVMANVFLEQIGLPLPAYPTLLVTGALVGQGQYTYASLLATAVIAALCADLFWYIAGRKYGRKVMGRLCRISLSPDSCVRQTESVYLRFGPPALLVCKFIPGFASISSALAGATNTKSITFIIFDCLGAALWAGSAILLGSLFSTAIDQLLAVLVEMGKWGGLLVILALTAFIASKWWERKRFLKALRMARISVDDLNAMLQDGKSPVIIDARLASAATDGKIPGALTLSLDQLDDLASSLDPNEEIVLYCACPNEVTAAKMAKAFINKGFLKVRPLAGGIDAWIEAGFRVETLPATPAETADGASHSS